MTPTTGPRTAVWRKSSNGDGGDCVEVAAPQGAAQWLVRDSKRAGGPALRVGGGAWQAFLIELWRDGQERPRA